MSVIVSTKFVHLLLLAPSGLVVGELTTPCHAMEQLIVISALPTSLAAATSSSSLRRRGLIASSMGLGLELLVLVVLPPSPQQAGSWPMGFHQSQKTASLALQAYRTCAMWLQLNWPGSTGKKIGMQGDHRAGGGGAVGSHVFSMCESQLATHKVVNASVPQVRNRLPLHMHEGMNGSFTGSP